MSLFAYNFTFKNIFMEKYGLLYTAVLNLRLNTEVSLISYSSQRTAKVYYSFISKVYANIPVYVNKVNKAWRSVGKI